MHNIFVQSKLPIEVWAYGSRLNGTAHSGSDLDLVIRSKSLKPLPHDYYLDLCTKIRESNIPILVELRDWAKLPDYFHKTISNNFEVLFTNLSITIKSINSKSIIICSIYIENKIS